MIIVDMTVTISDTLKLELLRRRARGERQYQIAHAAGLHPTILSSLIHGIVPVRPGDRRVVRLGEILGVPADECFETERGTER